MDETVEQKNNPMSSLVRDVREFMVASEYELPTSPRIPRSIIALLRRRLIAEEAGEAINAIHEEDIPQIAAELVDLVYVAIGAAQAYGIPFDVVWQKVHAANMRKVDLSLGEIQKDEFENIKKPEGWAPPVLPKSLYPLEQLETFRLKGPNES